MHACYRLQFSQNPLISNSSGSTPREQLGDKRPGNVFLQSWRQCFLVLLRCTGSWLTLGRPTRSLYCCFYQLWAESRFKATPCFHLFTVRCSEALILLGTWRAYLWGYYKTCFECTKLALQPALALLLWDLTHAYMTVIKVLQIKIARKFLLSTNRLQYSPAEEHRDGSNKEIQTKPDHKTRSPPFSHCWNSFVHTAQNSCVWDTLTLELCRNTGTKHQHFVHR